MNRNIYVVPSGIHEIVKNTFANKLSQNLSELTFKVSLHFGLDDIDLSSLPSETYLNPNWLTENYSFK